MLGIAAALGTCAAAEEAKVKLLTLDPGHFHAALVQAAGYPQVDSTVHVYSPGGPDLTQHLKRIDGYNTRPEQPTAWKEVTYTGPDYLERMLSEKKGNLVIIPGTTPARATISCVPSRPASMCSQTSRSPSTRRISKR